ncbi:MAG: DNA repair protein RadA [Gammaproteobacteria bacterium]|jgi:DNA repair protein RadA/Sms|nr:DNA repair protein RadA [Gammaproteobacteria bacterium]MDH3905611.1 DNA repair protein RadA [Gammaproteobacteria bacterium]MDH4004637.1 DNA repair protein RadA [Gammaproteobacteria bacterium]NCF59232.1 DNA repair protein RadA [Gammaproteobacteria bacterium]
MAKQKTAYVCAQCGAHSVKWAGQCPDCGAWNTLSEFRVAAAAAASGAEATGLDALELDPEERYATGFAEFDRVLGGGLVPGAVVLLGGDPGVGKSTLLQQVSGHVQGAVPVLYATGEESLRQVSQRARRLAIESTSLKVLADTGLENVLGEVRRNASRVLIIDSIQTMTAAELTSAPGSVAQLRECVGRIVQFAKQNEVSVFVIGHVTKEGAIAGPRVVEHMVDTVLYFENDPASRYTMIRSVKNRFGATGEMGVFAMTGCGFREVRNPSAIFLSRDTLAEPGSVVSVAWEGSRALLVEMQALVADGGGGYPKRVAQGVDQNRLGLLLAVMQRHGDAQLGSEDVFVNVVGGLKMAETAVDLPTMLSVVSSFRDRPCREGLVSFGEIGLAGEVRPVRYGEERIAAAAKQGFSCAIVPRANVPRKTPAGIEIVAVSRIREAFDAAF